MGLREIKPADVLAMIRKVEARSALDVSRRLKQHVSLNRAGFVGGSNS